MLELQPNDIVDPSTGLTAHELMMTPCQTKEDLYNWLKLFLHVDLPDQIVDPTSNCTPMDMAWKVYSNCVHYNQLKREERETKMLFYASRMAMKTLAAAAVEFVVAIHDKRGVVHTAATLPQARKCYGDYFQRYLEKPIFQDIALGLRKNSSDQCTFQDGTNIKLIPVTRQAVQSQHEALLVRDEIDVVDDISAYRDLDGIPINMPDGRPPIDFGISVRKSSFGLVQNEIEQAQKTGVGVYHWNILDITEKCPDSKSGTVPCTLYIKNDTMQYIPEEQFKVLDKVEQVKYTAAPALEGCYKNCTIFAACQANLKKQNSKCGWLKKIDFVEAKLKQMSETVFIAQLLSRKPPTDGLVYSRFDDKNKKTYREMYAIFSGEEWSKPTMSLNDFIGVMKKHGIPAYAGVDWGFRDPSVCVVSYIDRNDNIFVVFSLSKVGIDNADFIKIMAEDIQPRFDIQMYYPDSANPSGISMMSKANLPVSRKVDKSAKSIYDGVQIVKMFVTTPGSNQAKLFVSNEGQCDDVIDEFQKYHHETDAAGVINDEKFEDTKNHCMDSLRYKIYTLYGRNRAILTVASSEDKKTQSEVVDLKGDFIRPPTAAELAAHIGEGRFEDNRDTAGKPPKDGGTGGTSGGMSWSFQ